MSAAIDALQNSTQRFRSVVGSLSDDQVRTRSYDDDWTIADVASHLGSQSEIFGTFLEAAERQDPAPDNGIFPPIWDRWNAKSPTDQVADSVTAQERFMQSVLRAQEEGDPSLRVKLFGFDVDLDGFAVFRLGEHAVHTWDVAVAVDPSATVSPDAVELLVGNVTTVAGRSSKPVAGADPVVVATTDGHGAYRITLDNEVSVDPVADAPADVRMPAEALLRLVYGRLDSAHTPEGVEDPNGRLDDLRKAFPGF